MRILPVTRSLIFWTPLKTRAYSRPIGRNLACISHSKQANGDMASTGNRETDALEEEMAEEGGVYDPRRYRRRRARRDDGPMLESEGASYRILAYVWPLW